MNLTPLELLELVYESAKDSRISFCAKGPKGFEELASINASNIKELLPTVEPHLSLNGFFSLNGYSLPSKTRNRKTGLPMPARREVNLQRLNGLFVDVDSGRHSNKPNDPENEPTQDAMYRALDNCLKHDFPLPTLWAESGQGFYMLWLFSESLYAWPENQSRVKSAQKKLEFIHPAIDRSVTDVARIARIPNTQHGITGNLTEWRTGPNNGTKYPQEELFGRLSIESQKRSYSLAPRVTKCPARAAGMRVLNANRASDIRALHQSRGGIEEGMRRYALTTYAVARLLEGASPFDIGQEIERMARECQPAFPSHQNDAKTHSILLAAMELKRTDQHWGDDAIARRLEVTAEEADRLKLKQLRPQDSEAKAKARAARALNEGRPKRATRQEFVKSYLTAQPEATNPQLLAAAQAQGVKASLRSIKRDRASLKA